MKAATQKAVKYISKPPNAKGYVAWDKWEDEMWADLMKTQNKKIQGLACPEYIKGLEILNLPLDKMPQLPEVSAAMRKETGWAVEPVPCLISFEKFFKLLAEQKFPCATFIRVPEEKMYLEEPDIFHEIYGHCPLLTNKFFAEFNQRYGEIGCKLNDEDRVNLARLYWFTIEFGLLKTKTENLIYGGGILSSIGETGYCYQNQSVEIRRFNVLDVFRTPYRIDIMQPIYYYLEDLSELADLTEDVILTNMEEAKRLGKFQPTFTPKPQIIQEAPSA